MFENDSERVIEATQEQVIPEGVVVPEKPIEVSKIAPTVKSKATIPSEEEKTSWLNSNISSIIAIMIIIAAFTFFVYILNFDFSENSKLKDIVILLIGIISTLATTVVNYYFGSSLGSSAKTKIMQKQKS